MKKIFIYSILTIQILVGQYEIGDVVENINAPICSNGDGTLNLFDYNGDTNGGNYFVILISILASWCGPSQEEAPVINSIYENYKDQGFIAIASGFDWNSPYSCEEWKDEFGVTFPIVDDDTDSDGFPGDFSNAFLDQIVIPFNIIIDHTMTVRYIDTGLDSIEIVNTIEEYLSQMNLGNEQELFLIDDYILHPTYPNPFNATTTINYNISKPSNVIITIHNINGRVVEDLYSKYTQAGNHQIIWNANKQTTGIYFISLKANEKIKKQKILFLK